MKRYMQETLTTVGKPYAFQAYWMSRFTVRVRQFRLHFFRYEAKCETLTFSPVLNKNE